MKRTLLSQHSSPAPPFRRLQRTFRSRRRPSRPSWRLNWTGFYIGINGGYSWGKPAAS